MGNYHEKIGDDRVLQMKVAMALSPVKTGQAKQELRTVGVV